MIKLAATMSGANTKVDGSLSLRFSTQELSSEDKTKVFDSISAFGWLVFSDSTITEADIPNEPPADEKQSPAQRYRNVLFRYYEANGGDKLEFNNWYRKKLEKEIQEVKDKLEELDNA